MNLSSAHFHAAHQSNLRILWRKRSELIEGLRFVIHEAVVFKVIGDCVILLFAQQVAVPHFTLAEARGPIIDVVAA